MIQHTSAVDPLHLHPTIRTSDTEEFGNALVNRYGAAGFAIPDPTGLKTRGNFVELSHIAIGFSACGAPAEVSFPECDFARLQLALSGRASTISNNVESIVDDRQLCVTSPGRTARLQYGRDFEHLVVRVKRQAIEQQLEALLGAPPKKVIYFEPSIAAQTPAARGLRKLIAFMIEQLDAAVAEISPPVREEMEKAITTAFLHATRHSLSEAMQRDVKALPPASVRRIEDYIEANWKHAITLEHLAKVGNVSARAIFKAFRQNRGYSPMAFVKKVRLMRARQMLVAPEMKTSVTGVAFACAFSNLGHFARDYRQSFGELPSETLRRAQGSGPVL